MALTVETFVYKQALKALTVDVETVDNIAPCGAFFEVLGLTDDMYRNAGFVWEFFDSDADGYPQVRAGAPWRDISRRFAIGPMASRVFETPETVRWTLDIYYQGQARRIRGSMAVQDPSTVYDDSNTYYFSPSATWDGEAVGATNQYSDWATLVGDFPNTADAIIKVRKGETADVSGFDRIRRDGFKITTYGTGSRPVFNIPSANAVKEEILRLEVAETKVLGISFVGTWDSTTESYTGAIKRLGIQYNPLASNILNGKILVHDCSFDGLEHNVYLVGNSFSADDEDVYNHLCILSENVHTNRSNFGVFAAQARKLGIIGSNIGQDVDALGGGAGTNTDPDHNRHGPVRSAYVQKAVYWGNDMFSPHGWSLLGGPVPAHQPCIRHLSSGFAGAKSAIGGNFLEGGYNVLQVAQSAGGTSAAGLHRISSNCILGTANSTKLLAMEFPGTAADNNVLIYPQVPPEWSSLSAVGTGDNPAPVSGEEDGPISMNGNTIVDLSTGGFSTAIVDGGAFSSAGYTNFTEANTAYYAPNLSSDPDTSLAPFDTTQIASPKYKGLRWFDAPTLDTSYATPSATIALYSPDTGSAALGAATDAPVLDFFGNVRGASTATGAFDGVVS